MVQQIIFGMTATSVSLYLRFGRRILIEALKREPIAAIKFPRFESICTYQAAIREKHPSLDVVWCCMLDGLKLYLQQAGDATITTAGLTIIILHQCSCSALMEPYQSVAIMFQVQFTIAKWQNWETSILNWNASMIPSAVSVPSNPLSCSRNILFLSSRVNRIQLPLMLQILLEVYH